MKLFKKDHYYQALHPSYDSIVENEVSAIVDDPRIGLCVIFKQNGFAPGIWAGTEGMVINYNGSRYKIDHVYFEDRMLRVIPLGPISGAV